MTSQWCHNDVINLPQSELTTLMGQWNNIQHCKPCICVSHIPWLSHIVNISDMTSSWRHICKSSKRKHGDFYYFVQDGFKINSTNFQLSTNFFPNLTKLVPILLDYRPNFLSAPETDARQLGGRPHIMSELDADIFSCYCKRTESVACWKQSNWKLKLLVMHCHHVFL